MKALSGLHDLMALATIRRLLLELGYVLHPEAAGNVLGPLQLWMREPLSQFDGQSPLEVLAGGDGKERIRECLAEIVGSERPRRPWPAP